MQRSVTSLIKTVTIGRGNYLKGQMKAAQRTWYIYRAYRGGYVAKSLHCADKYFPKMPTVEDLKYNVDRPSGLMPWYYDPEIGIDKIIRFRYRKRVSE